MAVVIKDVKKKDIELRLFQSGDRVYLQTGDGNYSLLDFSQDAAGKLKIKRVAGLAGVTLLNVDYSGYVVVE